MNNKNVLCVILAGMLALSASACTKSSGKEEKTASTAVNVTVYAAGEGNIENKVTYTGEIKENERVSISSKVSAKALSVNAEEGQYVRQGDVLLALDSTDLQLSYNQALASYNSAKANYEMTANATTQQSETNARQKLSSAQIEYDNALASYEREKNLYDNNTSLVSAKNAYEDAKTNLERTQRLFEIGAVTQIELNTAKNNVENAQAALSNLESTRQASLDSAKNRMDNAATNLNSAKENLNLTVTVVNKESISTSKAAVDSAKANLDIAKNNLSNTTITAPISGYISSKNVNKGQLVPQGIELFSIKNTNSVDGEISVTEAVISHITVGTPAQIIVKSAGVENIQGSVTLVNQTKNAATGLYTVRVTIPNQENILKVGMFADITLTTNSVDNTITIPSEAIMQEGNQLYVYVADGENKAQRRNITAGISDGERTQIISGISPGEKVIVKGREYLSEKNNEITIIS